ncbi:MAG: RsmB/NOP family class I SAM-dependent RNA methyltransferase [Bacteroidia bacterium]|nr:RsmB/NOP family class I SAM-dependent RNA methyltransferase [Bacteroidia bacterium]
MRWPPAFVERMRARLGAEAEAFLAALSQPSRTALRLHPEKGRALFPEAERVVWHPLGRLLAERPDFEQEPFWHAGAYYVQEASGMSLRVFVPERRPLRVIDLSAAPGGKATLLLGELGWEGGLLIANDPDPRRRTALKENLARWGIPAYLVTGRHPAWWAERFPGLFDVVVLDAPCSGEGLWRKDPRAACQWHPDLSTRMARLQRSLLHAAKALVAPGGVLLYSTCTFAPAENEENILAVIAADPAWEAVLWPGELPSAVVPTEGPAVGYYFYPHRGPGEGFFVSAWRRREGALARAKRKVPTGEFPRAGKVPIPLPEGLIAIERGESLQGLMEGAAALVPAPLWKEAWEAHPLWEHSRPAQAAALLSRPLVGFPERALPREAFPAYLAGQPFPAQAPYERVTIEGASVGWLYKGRPSLPFTWKRFLRHR